MFEGLKSALGLATSADKPAGLSEVDAVTHQMLQDLNLPDPVAADAADAPVDKRDPLEEAQEVVTDWMNEGYDIEQELHVVFEALFDTQAQADSYLVAAKGLALEDVTTTATRPFVDSIAAAIVIAMIPAPEEIVRIEQALAPLAKQAGGQVDGYFLEGHADGG